MRLQGAEVDAVEGAPRRLGGRIGFAVVDQALYAGANVAITLIAARSLDPRGFGAFGVAYVAYTLAIGVMRAIVAEPALVRSRLADERGRWRRDVLASGVAGAVVLASAVVVGALLAPDVARGPLLAVAVGLPGMLVQDLGRYLAFADRRPEHAVRLDLIWIAVQTVGLSSLLWSDEADTVSLLLVWGAGGTVAALGVLRADRPAALGFDWVRRSWPFSWRYGMVFATTAGTTYVTMLLLGGLRGVQAVGAVRGAQVVFGPLNVAYVGLLAALVPEEAEPERRPGLRRRLVRTSGVLVVVAVAVTICCLAVPDSWARLALGATWDAVNAIIVPMGVVAIMGSVVAGANVGLRATQEVRRDLQVNLALMPVHIGAPLTGAVLAGVQGYMWGLAAGAVVAAIVWWAAFESTGHRRR